MQRFLCLGKKAFVACWMGRGPEYWVVSLKPYFFRHGTFINVDA